MGNYQCSKTSKALFNPKIGQNSSLNPNILKKPKENLISESFSTSSHSQFSSTQHTNLRLDNYVIEKKLLEKNENNGSLMLMRSKQDRSQLYVLKTIDKGSIATINEELYLQYLNTFSKCNFVINVKNTFISNNNLNIIMEYCSGGLFMDLLNKQKRVSEDVAKFYFAEIILALETLENPHQHYRYLGIDNILIDADAHVKISNFGGNKFIFEELNNDQEEEREEEEENREISEITLKMTKYSKMEHIIANCQKSKNKDLEILNYLAPEMLENYTASRSSDLWTLGILLYQMVTGDTPFPLYKKSIDSINIEKIKKIIKEDEPKFPKCMSEECRGLIWGLLRKYKGDRIGNKGWKEIKTHRFFEGFQWKDIENKTIPAPYSVNLQVNCLKKQEDYRKYWKIQDNMLKKPNRYLERTFYIGKNLLF